MFLLVASFLNAIQPYVCYSVSFALDRRICLVNITVVVVITNVFIMYAMKCDDDLLQAMADYRWKNRTIDGLIE